MNSLWNRHQLSVAFCSAKAAIRRDSFAERKATLVKFTGTSPSADGSSEDCMGQLPEAGRMKPLVMHFRKKLGQRRRSSVSPFSLNRISGRRVSPRAPPAIQRCRNMLHTGIRIVAFLYDPSHINFEIRRLTQKRLGIFERHFINQ